MNNPSSNKELETEELMESEERSLTTLILPSSMETLIIRISANAQMLALHGNKNVVPLW